MDSNLDNYQYNACAIDVENGIYYFIDGTEVKNKLQSEW